MKTYRVTESTLNVRPNDLGRKIPVLDRRSRRNAVLTRPIDEMKHRKDPALMPEHLFDLAIGGEDKVVKRVGHRPLQIE